MGETRSLALLGATAAVSIALAVLLAMLGVRYAVAQGGPTPTPTGTPPPPPIPAPTIVPFPPLPVLTLPPGPLLFPTPAPATPSAGTTPPPVGGLPETFEGGRVCTVGKWQFFVPEGLTLEIAGVGVIDPGGVTFAVLRDPVSGSEIVLDTSAGGERRRTITESGAAQGVGAKFDVLVASIRRGK